MTATHPLHAATAPSPALPGPATPWWGFPMLARMKRDYLGVACELQAQHGDLVAMRLGAETVVDVFHPDAVRALLVDQADALVRWERGPEVFAQTLGQGVLVTEGATWQRQRRMLVPAFSPRRLAGYAALMVDASRHQLDRLAEQARAGGPVDLMHTMTQLTMDVILRTLFGVSPGAGMDITEAQAREAERAVAILMRVGLQEMLQPFTWPAWLPLPGHRDKRWALALLDQLIWRQLQARDDEARLHPEQAAARTDLLAMLRAVRDDGEGGQGGGLSPQALRDECMTLFQAGHETTATALAWWCGLMAHHPEHQSRARAEVQALLGVGAQARPPTLDDLPRLPWLQASLKEALRLYPPIAGLMSRRATRAVTVAGHTLAAGTVLRVTPFVLHRDPRWFPLPLAYRPERWQDGSADTAPRGAYLPFGTGPRVCLGQHFALMEMGLVAAMLLQRLSLQAEPGCPLPAHDMQVTLRPAGGMPLRVSAV